VVDQDAPGLEAHFIRMKEAVAGQLTRFSLVGAVVDNLHQKQWEARRNAALAALGEAALKACLKDGDLKARLLPRVAAGDRARVRALLRARLGSGPRIRQHSPPPAHAGARPGCRDHRQTGPSPAPGRRRRPAAAGGLSGPRP
jgi:hypothetical protein